MAIPTFLRHFLLLVLVSQVGLMAAVVPGRWEKVDSQPPSTGLMLILKSGERINCFFKSSDPETLTVVDPVAGERRIPKSEVRKVESIQVVPDSVVNGILIGFGIGAGGYLAIHAPLADLQEHDFPAALAIGGIGALIGLLADKAVERPTVLYTVQ